MGSSSGTRSRQGRAQGAVQRQSQPRSAAGGGWLHSVQQAALWGQSRLPLLLGLPCRPATPRQRGGTSFASRTVRPCMHIGGNWMHTVVLSGPGSPPDQHMQSPAGHTLHFPPSPALFNPQSWAMPLARPTPTSTAASAAPLTQWTTATPPKRAAPSPPEQLGCCRAARRRPPPLAAGGGSSCLVSAEGRRAFGCRGRCTGFSASCMSLHVGRLALALTCATVSQSVLVPCHASRLPPAGWRVLQHCE